MKLTRCMFVFALAGLATLARAEAAPGVDCSKAMTSVDKLICADPRLTVLAREVDRVFALIENEKDLPRDGFYVLPYPVLAQAQKKWLGQRATDCAVDADAGVGSPAAQCLADLYALRLKVLRLKTSSAGPALDDLQGALVLQKTVSLDSFLGANNAFIGGRYRLMQRSSQGRLKLTLSDLSTATATPIEGDFDAKNEARLLSADPSGALIAMSGRGVDLLQTDAKGHVLGSYRIANPPIAAAVAGNNLLAIERVWNDPLTHTPPRTKLTTFALGAKQADGVWPVPDGDAHLWGGRLVLLTPQGHVAIYTNHMQELSDTALPIGKVDPDARAGFAKATVFGDYLLIPTTGKGTCVFNLAHQRTLPFIRTDMIDPQFAHSGDLLFAFEGASGMQPQDAILTTFDLTTSRGLTRFHLTANHFDVDGDRLTAYLDERGGAVRASTYRMDLARIRSQGTLVQTLLAAHARAREAMARNGSVFAALDAMDLLETEALSDAGLDPRLQPVAVDYASWLALTIGRRAQGISMLEQLYAADAGNTVIRRRLGAALLRDFLLDGDVAHLARARGLLDRADFPSADLSQWQGFRPAQVYRPLDNSFQADIYASGDRLYTMPPYFSPLLKFQILHMFDRNTLRPLAEIDLGRKNIGPLEFDVGGLIGVTTDKDTADLWFAPASQDARPTALSLDLKTGKVVPHQVPVPVDYAMATEHGELTCHGINDPQHNARNWNCVLLDPRTFKFIQGYTITQPRLAELSAAIPDSIAARLLLDASNYPGTVVAASERWTALINYNTQIPQLYSTTEDSSLGPMIADSGLAYRDGDAPGTPLRASTRSGSHALVVAPLGELLQQQPDLEGISGLNLASNVGTTLTDLRAMDVANPWAVAGNLLFCLDGGDLVAYDLKLRTIAAVIPGLVSGKTVQPPEPSGYAADDFPDDMNRSRKRQVDVADYFPHDMNQFRKLQVDRDYLFVVASDDSSRVLSLSAFAAHAALGARLFKTTENLLSQPESSPPRGTQLVN